MMGPSLEAQICESRKKNDLDCNLKSVFVKLMARHPKKQACPLRRVAFSNFAAAPKKYVK